MQYTNEGGLPLLVAGWLATDDYDYVSDPSYVSVTTLMKPTQQVILSKRVPAGDKSIDVSAFIASRIGSAIHDSIEQAWTTKAHSMLASLGYPAGVVERIKINPDDSYKPSPDDVLMHFEKRVIRDYKGWKIGGKFDAVVDGQLYDFKSTSVWSYMMGSKDEDYCLQGSCYRWLNPTLIINDEIYIIFFFTDWSKMEARKNPAYPQSKIMLHKVRLKSHTETQRWIDERLNLLKLFWDAPAEVLPACTPEEMWQSAPVYKYYADPSKTDKSTKNFTSLSEAEAHKAKAGKGIVKTVLAEPKRCLEFCSASSICMQRMGMNV